jgi:hypothetical protein
MIGRAAHTLRTPMAKETVMDELADKEKENNSDITAGDENTGSIDVRR